MPDPSAAWQPPPTGPPSKAWTGSLEEDHSHALELLQRDALEQAASNHLSPEQTAEYLEIPQDQFLQLVRPDFVRKGAPKNQS